MMNLLRRLLGLPVHVSATREEGRVVIDPEVKAVIHVRN